MRAILTNQTNFDQPWAESGLYDRLMPSADVLVMLIDSDEEWWMDAATYREDLLRPLLHYGIHQEQIHILSAAELTKAKLESSDIVVLSGDNPRFIDDCLQDSACIEMLQNYQGIFLGIAGGAEVLMDTYRNICLDDREIYEGLGIVKGLTLFADYQQNRETVRAIIDDLEQNGRSVLVMPQEGAAVIDEGHLDLLGDSFLLQMSDLDDLYQLLDSMM